MDKKSESDVNSEGNKTAITEAEVKSEFGNGKTDDTDSVSKYESTEVLKSISKGEENKALASTSVIQKQDSVNVEAAEKLPETQIEEEVEDIDSQKTECMDVQEADDLQKSPIISQHVAEEIPEKLGKEAGDSQKNEGKDFEEADVDSSSQETYCSESSFQRTECATHQNIHITLESDSDSHILSAGTGSLGGASQATTVDVADLEVIPSSEADMFASQSSQEDTDALGDSSGTVADYSDFVKGSHDGSHALIQCSSSLSMDEPQDSSSKLKTSISKSARKRKKVESDLSDPESKLQRIVVEDSEGINVEQESCSKEGSSLGVHDLPASTSMDYGAKSKTSLPVVSPTKVTLKEKEVEISPKANRRQYSVMTSPKASRRLNFEPEPELVERQKAQFVLVRSSSKDNIAKIEECKTDDKKEGKNITDSPSAQSSADSSPEIEILNAKKSRQSIEVVFISSHSHDSARSSSQHKTSSGRKRSAEDIEEVIDIEDHADGKEADATPAESSDEELILHLSPSPSQKSVDFPSLSEKSSGLYSVNHTSYSSYKSSNADSLKPHSRSEQETSDTKKQDKKLLSSVYNSKKHSVYPIMEEDEEELKETEKSSQIQSSGSSSNSDHIIGSGNAIREKIRMPFSLSKQNIVSPEGSPSITDSFTTFSKVKDIAQLTSRQFVTPDSERQGRMSKRKRDNGKKDVLVVSIVGSDSESDSHSTPSEVQKKTKTDNGDVANGHKDTPSILPLPPPSLLPKGSLRCHSTPQTDHMIIPINETSASSIEQDSTQVNETEWEVVIKVKMRFSKQSNKEVFRVQQCEDVTEDVIHGARRLSDYSTSGGGLGDISSKNTSPSSTTSGPGPFSLLTNRLSLVSTISSSSSSSGGSSVALGVVRSKYATDGGQFLMPNNPGPKISRDRSFRSEEAFNGIRSGVHSSIVEGMERIERILMNSNPESPERIQGGRIRTVSGTKTDDQKPSDRYTPPDDSPQEFIVTKTVDETGSTNVAVGDVVPTPANVLKETPKSSTKSFKRSKSRSLAKKRSLPFSKSKSKEKESIGQEKNDSEIVPSVERKRGRQTPVRNKTTVSSLDDVITRTPKSKKKESSDSVIQNVPERPSVTRDITRTPEMSSDVLDDQLKPGAPVFARWTDRRYYSGKIKEEGKDGRWIVLFDDGNVKSVVEDFIIVVDVLSKGQLVYALVEDEDYLSGFITDVQKKRSGVMYSVELDEGDVVDVSRSSLFMTEDQAKILREDVTVSSPSKSTPHRTTDVSLDNVLEGKRSRIRNRELRNKLDMPGVSGESKITSRRKVSSPVLTESDAGSSVEDIDGVERESVGRDIKLRKVKGQGRSIPRKNWVSLLGPVPPEGSKIFADKYFLLTSSDVNQKNTSRNDSEDTQDTDQDGGEDPHFIPFSKSYITDQITAGGGKVCSRFEEVPSNKYDSCYLITDRPNQTAKFILCLAHRIQIVLHTWVIDCCMKNVFKPISNHLAPAGWSLEKREYVSRLIKERPLCLMNIGVVRESTHFLKFWELVLIGAGADVFAITPETNINELADLDVVVCNHGFPLDIQEQLKEVGKHVVSTTWIVQCLINGTTCAFT